LDENYSSYIIAHYSFEDIFNIQIQELQRNKVIRLASEAFGKRTLSYIEGFSSVYCNSSLLRIGSYFFNPVSFVLYMEGYKWTGVC